MATPKKEFNKMVDEAVLSIFAKGKPIATIEDEISYAVGTRGVTTVDRWRRDREPKKLEQMVALARYFVREASKDWRWVEELFRATKGWADSTTLAVEEIFGKTGSTSLEKPTEQDQGDPKANTFQTSSLPPSKGRQEEELPRSASANLKGNESKVTASQSTECPINLWGTLRAQGIDLPVSYIDRKKEMAKWYELLCTDNEHPKRIVMWGMGGIGKTTLAKALLMDSKVRKHFSRGVLWAQLSPQETESQKSVLKYLNRWCKLLEVEIEGRESEDREVLRSKLEKKIKSQNLNLLIVIDDVWYPEDAKALLIDGVSALITTRADNLVNELKLDPTKIVLLNEMTGTEAIELIKSRMKNWENNMEVPACQLAEMVGYLPLALNVGAALAQSYGWEHVLEGLQSEMGNCTLEMPDKNQLREYSLNVTLDLSYNTLTENARRLFHHLGLFLRNKIFKSDDLLSTMMWKSLFILYKDVSNFAWKNASIELLEKALVMGEEGRFHLHKAVSDYAAKQASKASDALGVHLHFIITEWYHLHSMTYDPPRKQAQLMKEDWPDIVRAWGEIYRWRFDLSSKLDLARLTYEFSEMGCNILGRQQQWDKIIEWTQKAQQIIKEDTQKDIRPYLEGLTMWKVDALLQKEQFEEVTTLVKERIRNSWVQKQPWWHFRYKVRRARCLLSQKFLNKADAALEDLQQALDDIISIKARNIEEDASDVELMRYTEAASQQDLRQYFSPPISLREDIEEFAILEAEIYWLLGDYEAELGQNPQQAEAHWLSAARYVRGSSFQRRTPCLVTDWWWFERITAKVVGLLAACQEWARCILLGQRWIEIRRILGLPVTDALFVITRWIISEGDAKFIAWASTQLTMLVNSRDERLPAIKDVVSALQEGLNLAAQGKCEEAVSRMATIEVPFTESVPQFPCSKYPVPEFPIEERNFGGRFDRWVTFMLKNNDLIAVNEDGKYFKDGDEPKIYHPSPYLI